jgi:hypothetical protein
MVAGGLAERASDESQVATVAYEESSLRVFQALGATDAIRTSTITTVWLARPEAQ